MGKGGRKERETVERRAETLEKRAAKREQQPGSKRAKRRSRG